MSDCEDINNDLAERASGRVAVRLLRTRTDYEDAHRELDFLAGCAQHSFIGSARDLG